MPRLKWDEDGNRKYETGTDRGVLYVKNDSGEYPKGVAWDGLTGVTESPDGAEPTDLWAGNIKYGTIRSTETFGGTISAYYSPEEFDECDGSVAIAKGVNIGQQTRKPFGLAYRTLIGSDKNPDAGYIIHIVYGATASPTERAYKTVNDSPEALELSWEFKTDPVAVTDAKATSHLTINSLLVDADKLAKIEDELYGTEVKEARLPLPDEIKEIMTAA